MRAALLDYRLRAPRYGAEQAVAAMAADGEMLESLTRLRIAVNQCMSAEQKAHLSKLRATSEYLPLPDFIGADTVALELWNGAAEMVAPLTMLWLPTDQSADRRLIAEIRAAAQEYERMDR